MLKKFWRNNKGIICGLFLLLFFRSAIADWYHVPSGSMQPNVLIGDRIWVNKLAYDVKVPFSNINLNRHAEPQVGDVIVFKSEKAGERLIKRVIGVPGDVIEMRNNRLFVNGMAVTVEPLQAPQSFDAFLNDREQALYFKEFLLSTTSEVESPANLAQTEGVSIRVSKYYGSGRDSFYALQVPNEHYWVMGDNRDNSADSRVIGFVPREELIGRAERVVVSLDNENYYLPRNGRYWSAL